MLFIEPMYVLAIPNPNFNAEDPDAAKQPEYLLRPNAVEFIHSISEKWEISIYSSRKADQLNQLVNILDPLKSRIRFVLDRRHCCITQQKKCIKDISLVQGISSDQILMLDYKPQNVAFCLNSSLVVVHWNGSDEDSELMPGLSKYLLELADQPSPTYSNQQNQGYSDYIAQIYKRIEVRSK